MSKSGQVSCYYNMVIFISIYIVKVGTGKLLLLHGDLYFYLHCQSGQVSCHYYMVIFISIYIVSRDR